MGARNRAPDGAKLFQHSVPIDRLALHRSRRADAQDDVRAGRNRDTYNGASSRHRRRLAISLPHIFCRPLQNVRERQRVIHHQAGHDGRSSQQLFRDRHLLHIAGSLVNPPDLGVAIQLLHRIIFRESDAAENFYGTEATRSATCDAKYLHMAASVTNARPASCRRAAL